MRPLIAIHSCSADIKNGRHEAIRATWLPLAREHADVLFFVGRESIVKLEGDEIQLDATEDKYNLIDKEAAIMRWAVNKGYRRILKTETDVYFNVYRLFDCNNHLRADVIGRIIGPGLGENYHDSNLKSFFQGHAIWYSAKAAEIVGFTLRSTYMQRRPLATYTVGKLDPSERSADLWSMQALYLPWLHREITMETDESFGFGNKSWHLQGDDAVKATTPKWMLEMHRTHNGT